MKNIFKKGLCVLAAAVMLAGCASDSQKEDSAEAEQTAEQSSYTFTDDMGREVTVDNPQRVVTLIGSFTDIWLLAGGSVVGACDDSWSSLNLDLPVVVINTG